MDNATFQAMYERATREGQAIRERGLYAIDARIEAGPDGDLIVIRYANGSEFRIPARLVQDVHDLSPEQLRHMTLGEPGNTLFWEEEGRDAYIPGLVSGCYGTRAWMQGLKEAAPA